MTRRNAATLALLGVLAVAALASGCRCDDPAPLPPPDQRYQLRGQIVRLPSGERRDMLVQHEAIDDFVGASGEVVGMPAMTMPFTVAEGASLEPLAPGDKIAFTFEVRWEHEPQSLMRDIRVLPNDTPLQLASPRTED